MTEGTESEQVGSAEQNGSAKQLRSAERASNGRGPGKSLVRALREHAGLTRQELADRMGIRVQSVWRLESRGTKVQVATVMRVAELVGAKIRWTVVQPATK